MSLVIRSVSVDEIRVGDDVFEQTVALTADAIITGWPQKTVTELAVADFSLLLEQQPEIIILGTGSRVVFAPRELIFAMARRDIGLEVMTTAAAARTFNVLGGEGRRIAAVLYI